MRGLLACLSCVSVAATATARTSSLDGTWHVNYPCLLSAAECQGRSDEFTLWFRSAGNHLCGDHLATAHLGDRVDEGDLIGSPSIVGTVTGAEASVTFKSTWGGTGHAQLSVQDGTLRWHVTDKDGIYWLPDDATLHRSKDSTLPNTACADSVVDPGQK